MNTKLKPAMQAMLPVGVLLIIVAIVLMFVSNGWYDRLEDTYYYLGLHMQHGKFVETEAENVLNMLEDMGIADIVGTGGYNAARFSTIASLLGLMLVIFYGVLRTIAARSTDLEDFGQATDDADKEYTGVEACGSEADDADNEYISFEDFEPEADYDDELPFPDNMIRSIKTIWAKMKTEMDAVMGVRYCSVCGEKLMKDALFCGNCGSPTEDYDEEPGED